MISASASVQIAQANRYFAPTKTLFLVERRQKLCEIYSAADNTWLPQDRLARIFKPTTSESHMPNCQCKYVPFPSTVMECPPERTPLPDSFKGLPPEFDLSSLISRLPIDPPRFAKIAVPRTRRTSFGSRLATKVHPESTTAGGSRSGRHSPLLRRFKRNTCTSQNITFSTFQHSAAK